jgi:uncharacterized protein YidB (DUF937 family)
MSDNNGFPSMTALLGLLAVAGYQNRDKISEWLGGLQQGQQPAGAPEGLDKVVGPAQGGAAGGLGGLLGGGLKDLIDRFQQGGRGEVADSWVRSGPNQEISDNDIEEAIGPDVLAEIERRTGLSHAELVKRLSRALPDAVDRYTPDGRVSA